MFEISHETRSCKIVWPPMKTFGCFNLLMTPWSFLGSWMIENPSYMKKKIWWSRQLQLLFHRLPCYEVINFLEIMFSCKMWHETSRASLVLIYEVLPLFFYLSNSKEKVALLESKKHEYCICHCIQTLPYAQTLYYHSGILDSMHLEFCRTDFATLKEDLNKRSKILKLEFWVFECSAFGAIQF